MDADIANKILTYSFCAVVAIVLFLMLKCRRSHLDITQTDKWGHLTAKARGDKFEAWCAELLRQYRFRFIQINGGSGDQGADIVCWKNGRRYVIQCKCYDRPIGNKPVQEAFAAIKFFGNRFVELDIPVVMTNTTFTSGGIEAARKCHVQLWDRETLDGMCRGLGIRPVPLNARKPAKKPAQRKRKKPPQRIVRRTVKSYAKSRARNSRQRRR